MWKTLIRFFIWFWSWLFGKTPEATPPITHDYITTENGDRIMTEYNKNIVK